MAVKCKIIFICALLMKIAHSHERPSDRLMGVKRRSSEGAQYWLDIGQERLRETLSITLNENIAKNVILFIGDGMSIPTVTSARILKGQRNGISGEEDFLEFENFPFSGLVKTYCEDYQVSDSASTATAMLAGVKNNYFTMGVDGSAVYDDCTSITDENSLSGIASWSQAQGKRTGFVTSTRVTHATPAASYAHSTSRSWECDADLDDELLQNCPEFKDIARQLVEDEPGKFFNVIMGGGLSYMDGNYTDLIDDDEGGCVREDGLNLWQDWLDDKSAITTNSYFVTTRSELLAVEAESAEYLMGIFANDHLPYEYMKREDNLDIPTLSEMVESAIKVLDKGENGYFLLVESGKIDHAHHGTRAHAALDETIEFANAVTVAVSLTNTEDTLLVVTADHSHTMSISGYPRRGDSIIGVSSEDSDDVGYTTLAYANGPSYDLTVVDGEIYRPDPRDTDTADYNYAQQSMNPKSSETHAGDDVSIYATGPMAHLFQGVMEQNYIAHAMSYASCVGLNLDHCNIRKTNRKL